MPTVAANARLDCGPFSVTIGCHQWDFLDGAVYLFRQGPTGPTGRIFRAPYDIRLRQRELPFIQLSVPMEAIRQLSIYAGTTATPVTFYPDATDLGTSWTVDWPVDVEFAKVTENRETFRVRVMQQSPGA